MEGLSPESTNPAVFWGKVAMDAQMPAPVRLRWTRYSVSSAALSIHDRLMASSEVGVAIKPVGAAGGGGGGVVVAEARLE